MSDEQLDACPKREVLDRVGDKWAVLVMGILSAGPRRYGQLVTSVPGVSQKMLTQTVRHLERDGLVTRTVTAAVPVRVDYELTDLGRSLVDPLARLEAWALAHVDDIRRARKAYDTRD